MEDQDKEYAKGFNAGYLLSQHEPELLKQLLKKENTTSEYFQGLTLGQKQYDREKLLSQIKEFQQTKDKSREL